MKKILLIEDNLEMRENIAEILELASYNVITAENGKIGVDFARKELPDLIICDIMMPELDGFGVLYMLSKEIKTACIPFIFLTAKAEKSDMRKGMGLGADDYLTKPFDEMELLSAIESRLKKNDILKKEYSRTAEGLNEFINEATHYISLGDIAKDRKILQFNKKSLIYQEENFPNAVYFITEGKAKGYKTDDYGKEYITELYNQGDFIGFMPVLEDTTYSDSVMALDNTRVAVIPKDEFNALINSNRDIAMKFIRLLSNNIKEKEERLLRLAYGSVRERVAEALIILYNRFHADEQKDFSISFSREDLANMVGTATESLIRTLSEFKEDKLIESEGRKIRILNMEKLKKVASL